MLLAVTLTSALSVPTSAAASVQPTRAQAVQVPQGSIVLDGALNEAAWRQAPVLKLTEQDPHPGQPTPYVTVLRVLRDSTHLYFGVICTDPDSANLAMHSLERDRDQKHDDHVTIVLDTLDTHHLGYVFQVNAGGARTDGLMSPASSDPNYDWDGIWNAKVRRTATGWTAEIAIDVRSLQIRKGADVWGLNIQRYLPRDQLSLQWTGISLDASIFDLTRMGSLAGIGHYQQGHGLEIAPYALVRHDSVGNRSAGQVGGDVRYHLTPGITATLTFNPDFAEAEADTDQVNLTRFSLFFPESGVLFGRRQHIHLRRRSGRQQHLPAGTDSRRIGLVSSETVRVDAGAKILGSDGPWTIGALGVHMGRSDVSNPTDLFVGRLTYDVDDHLRIGTLLTHGDPTGATNNSFTGVDAVWHTSTFRGDKNLVLSGWAAHSGDPLPGKHAGWGVFANYPTTLERLFSVDQFGEALNPALGFLLRPGTRQYDAYIEYAPRPTGDWLRWTRQFFYQLELFQVDDLRGTTQTRRIFAAPFNVATARTHTSSRLDSRLRSLERTVRIAKGVTLPVAATILPLPLGDAIVLRTAVAGRQRRRVRPFLRWPPEPIPAVRELDHPERQAELPTPERN